MALSGGDNAALTAALGSAFPGQNTNEWDITESKFRGVRFHIFSNPDGNYGAAVPHVQDKGGRRKTLYEFPYKSGQTTGDLGSRGKEYSFDIVFFGPDYLAAYTRFVLALDQATPAILTHPVTGDVLCVPVDWVTVHESEKNQCATMHVDFIEHTYTAGQLASKKPNSSSSGSSIFRQAVINAVKVFQAVNNARLVIAANKNFVQSFINGALQELDTFKATFASVLQDLYLTFSPEGSVSITADLPGVLPVQLGGAASSSSVFPLVDQDQTPFAEVPATASTTTPIALATVQAQSKVNAVRAQAQALVSLLNAANNGQGAFEFYDEVVSLKQSAVLLQTVLEQGVASSQSQITDFTTPRLMSIREVAWAVGLSPDDCEQVDVLNPQLDSVNYIPAGTVLKVPVVQS